MEDHIYLLWWLSQRMTDELLWRRVSFFGRRSVAMIAVCSLLPSGRKKKSRLTHSLSTLESDSSRTAQGQTAHCFIGHLHCWQWQSDLLFKGKIQKKQIDSKVARIKATFSDLESIRTINDWDTLHTHIISVIRDWLIRIVKWIIIEHIRSYIHSKSIQVDHLRIKSVRRWK